MEQDKNSSSNIGSKFALVALIFLGAIIGGVCLLLMKSNLYIYTIFMSLYICIYSIIIIVYLYKHVNTSTSGFNILVNMSMYTMCLVISVAIFAVYLMLFKTQK